MDIDISDIDFMMHCHIRGCIPHPRIDAPDIREAITKLLEQKLIQPYNITENDKLRRKINCWVTTDRGAAWIKMLCNTPFPIQGWVDGRDGSVVD